MNSDETRRYDMLKRVRNFGEVRAADFPDTSLGHELFREFSDALKELDANATNQASGANAAVGGTRTKGTIREELIAALTAINRTAKAMAFDTPGLEDKFRLPRSGSDQALLNAARAFAVDAAPLKAGFLRHEMAETFLEELQTQIDAFELALNHRATAKGVRVSATVGIDSALTRGVSAVRRLDAVIQNKFRNDAATLAAWTTASHVERANRSAAATVPAPVPGPEPPRP